MEPRGAALPVPLSHPRPDPLGAGVLLGSSGRAGPRHRTPPRDGRGTAAPGVPHAAPYPLAREPHALMPLALYLDQHVPRAIATGLRLRGVDVLTAFEDGASDLDDPALLDR